MIAFRTSLTSISGCAPARTRVVWRLMPRSNPHD